MSAGVDPNAKLLSYRDKVARQLEVFKKKREREVRLEEEEKRRKEEEKRREDEEERGHEEFPRNDTEVVPATVSVAVAEVAEPTAARAGERASSPAVSPSDLVFLSVRQEELARARLEKRALSEGDARLSPERANTGAFPPAVVAGPSTQVVAGGAAREQQGEPASTEFDFGFNFEGRGKGLSEFPELCAEYLSSIKSADKSEVELTAEDLFSEKVYCSWAQQTVQAVASTNHMVRQFDNCLKKACEQLLKKQKRIDWCHRIIELGKQSNAALELRFVGQGTELAEEKAANAALKDKLKSEKARLRSEKARLRSSRAFEVAKERELAEERLKSRFEAKLGKLKCYFDAMDEVFAKQTFLNQATCLKGVCEAEEKGVLISPEEKEIIENDLKTFFEEIKEIKVMKIVPSDFEMTPDEDRMPAEQWVPSSPPSPPSEGSFPGGVDDQTGEPLAPLFPPADLPEQPSRPSS